jgi:proteasome accessory factor B
MVWREGTLSAESRRAILKLRSLGVTSDEPVIGYAPRIRVRDAAFEPLNIALEKHVVVRFSYVKPGESAARTRTVEPFALIQHQGRWLLHGFDRDAKAQRNFLLRRIVSPVTTTNDRFAEPPQDVATIALAELERVWDERVAVVEVVHDSDAATRLAKRRGTTADADGTLRVHYSDLDLLADELAGFGPEALVKSPPELRDAVLSRLLRTAADHG